MAARPPTSSDSVIARLPLRAPEPEAGAHRRVQRAPTALDDALPLPPLAGAPEPLPPRAGDARITFRAPTVAATPAARRLAGRALERRVAPRPLPRRRLASGTGAPPLRAAVSRPAPVVVPRPLPKPPPTLWLLAGGLCLAALALLLWAL